MHLSDEQYLRFNVLLENMSGQMGALSEGHIVLVAEIGGLRSDVTGLKTDMVEVKTQLTSVDLRLANVEQRLTNVEHHLELNGASRSKRRKPRKPTRKR